MNRRLATLTWMSKGIFDHFPILIDGENCIAIDKTYCHTVCASTGLDSPIFSHEVSEDILNTWEFMFELGEKIPITDLVRATMSKPTQNVRKGRSWQSSVTPCDVACSKCKALYPVFGRFALREKQTCDHCGYVYEFCDI